VADRSRLLRALKDDADARSSQALSGDPIISAIRAGVDRASRPSSAASAGAASASSQWGVLGRVPAGWHRTESQRKPRATRAVPAAFADACTGGDSEIEDDEAEAGWEPSVVNKADARAEVEGEAATAQEVLILEPMEEAPPHIEPRIASSRPGTATRPSTANTASGEARANAGKICCYQCFRQAYQQHAVEVEDAQHSTARLLCSEDCASRFRQLSAAREKRERELGELRGVMRTDVAAG